MKAAAILLLALAMSGCVTRQVTIDGACADDRGAPRSGVIVTGKEIRGHWWLIFLGPFAGPVLPEISPLATAISDGAGKFSLQLRSTRSMLLDIRDPAVKATFGGEGRVSVPEEGEKLSLSVVTEGEYLSSRWSK